MFAGSNHVMPATAQLEGPVQSALGPTLTLALHTFLSLTLCVCFSFYCGFQRMNSRQACMASAFTCRAILPYWPRFHLSSIVLVNTYVFGTI